VLKWNGKPVDMHESEELEPIELWSLLEENHVGQCGNHVEHEVALEVADGDRLNVSLG